MKIKKGDLVQLDTWFGDVYAEVIKVDFGYIHVVQYNKGGTERWCIWENVKNVRTVAHTELEKAFVLGKAGVLYLSKEYLGSFGRHKYWGTPASTEYYSNRREKLEDIAS
jgi:hypothetical protein